MFSFEDFLALHSQLDQALDLLRREGATTSLVNRAGVTLCLEQSGNEAHVVFADRAGSLFDLQPIAERGGIFLRPLGQFSHDTWEVEQGVDVFTEAGGGLRRPCSTDVIVQMDHGTRSAS